MQGDRVSCAYQMDMVPVLISAFEIGDIGVAFQMMHDFHFTSDILYILY